MISPITSGLILAGGRSTRMGGQDKARLTLAGQSLLAHVITALSPQVDRLAINSNAEPGEFSAYGLPVIADRIPGFAGPLAGIHAGLADWPDDWVLTVAVDLPLLPADLVPRLRARLGSHPCVYASDGARHALALLWAPHGANRVADYLNRGGRALHEFLAAHGTPVIFDRPHDRGLFMNINTPNDLARAERELATG